MDGLDDYSDLPYTTEIGHLFRIEEFVDRSRKGPFVSRNEGMEGSEYGIRSGEETFLETGKQRRERRSIVS